nr:MAG TPA: putative nucleotidyltransferase [Caudoviricetes sp.]
MGGVQARSDRDSKPRRSDERVAARISLGSEEQDCDSDVDVIVMVMW